MYEIVNVSKDRNWYETPNGFFLWYKDVEYRVYKSINGHSYIQGEFNVAYPTLKDAMKVVEDRISIIENLNLTKTGNTYICQYRGVDIVIYQSNADVWVAMDTYTEKNSRGNSPESAAFRLIIELQKGQR